MKVVIAGCGIGGLTTALALHQAGIDVEIFEQAREVRELGVGINLLPHAVKELAALGLLPQLDRAGIRTRRLIYMNRYGQPVWDELRGLDAGYDLPQISIHRGKLQTVLYRAAIARLGARHIHIGHCFVDFDERAGGVVARFERCSDGRVVDVAGDALIGVPSSGLHSNSYTLARRVLPDLDEPFAGATVADALLEPTVIYVKAALELLRETTVHALAHITGGGLRNLLRLNPRVGFVIEDPLPVPPIIDLVRERGDISDAEAWEVFNMGCGFVAIVPEERADEAAAVLAAHHPGARRIGTVTADAGHVTVPGRYSSRSSAS